MDQLSFFVDDRVCGFWVKRNNIHKCNDCGFWYLDGSKNPYKFCPMCGRYMLQVIIGGE